MAVILNAAVGVASHKEGKDTVALGDFSHAEGDGSQSQGAASHSEGKETASIGENSHSEGEKTLSVGKSSHSEGSNTAAVGYYSHSEGVSTVAEGKASHAEGMGTKAKNKAQHVEGSYNKATSTDTIHETGIGTSDFDRKNGFEIYKNGKILFPELSDQIIRDEDQNSTVPLTKGYWLKSVSPKAFSTTEKIDFINDKNFTIRLDGNAYIDKPLNWRVGLSGQIYVYNDSDTEIEVKLHPSFITGTNTNIFNLFPYEFLKINYYISDGDNILCESFIVQIHVPLLVGNGDYILVSDQNYLLT